MARRRNYPLFENLEVIDIADKGKAIAKFDEQVVILDHAVPGDIVDAQAFRKRKSYFEARVVKTHKYSEYRLEHFCEHFILCGGCKWQDMEYSRQLYYKQKQVEDQLTRIGHLDLPEISEIIASEKTKFYRNKLEYTFSNRRWIETHEPNIVREEHELNAIGFHIPGRFDKILKLNNCYLQPNPSNDIRNFVEKESKKLELGYYDIRKHVGGLRNLIIRTTQTGETMVLLSMAEDFNSKIEELLNKLNTEFKIASLMYVINTKLNDTINDLEPILFKGKDHIIETLNGLSFKIGPKSFFQTNTIQAEKLYDVVKEFANPQADQIIYDLYTGTGTIANFLASECKEVIGVEYIPEAIDDANENAKLNNIDNTKFFAGDIKDIINNSFIKENGKPDTIVLDPPRAGMHDSVTFKIRDIEPSTIVYVSCNASTQARDLSILCTKYVITNVQPVDMFPHTQHVENVVKLVLK